ncbi:hypothetical protein ACTWPB_11600 [Nocardia sp. IBHARD005]|uniref:hypothetical protein n=1 Tax=Nocardia sp. IBHARD005 TaxID=3457765 RepID=UPI0040591FC1
MADEINYGQAEIGAFVQGASGGEFSFEPDAVRAAVKEIDTYLAGLRASDARMQDGEEVSGFGTLLTGVELQDGFRKKATLSRAAINQLVQGAMQIQEGFLRSANLLEEADGVSARRIQLASQVVNPQ